MPARNFSFLLLAVLLWGISPLGPAVAWGAPLCRQGEATRVWTAPLVVQPGERLEIMAVAATDGELTDLVVTDPAGRRSELPAVRGGGPPWSLRGGLAAPARGSYRIEARRAGRVVACTEVEVGGGAGERGRVSGTWRRRRSTRPGSSSCLTPLPSKR